MQSTNIRPRERDSIRQALLAGVVPRQGLRYIQVGRAREVEQVVRDMDRIADGGAAIRFPVGDFGAGKTFFLHLTGQVGFEKGMVVMSADVAPDRRLHATGGQARSLYAEMARNTATRSRPDGGAMASVVERFVTNAISVADDEGRDPNTVIREKLAKLEELTGGYDFATVVARYWKGYDSGDDELQNAAMRWLRGEFTTKTDARKALGVRTIVDDSNVYDQLKLMALFVREAGYNGLVVILDEMVNLYKLTNSQARQTNYEQILRILNDVLQGTASHLGFFMGGTPEFLMDTRRGLYSYEALRSRLAENAFARNGNIDMSGPVIRLTNLTPEDIYVLLGNVRNVMQDGEATVPDDAILAYMNHCSERIGDAYFRTPRNTVIGFAQMLSYLEQYPEEDWRSLVKSVDIYEETENGGVVDNEEVDDGLASFKL